VSAKKAAPRGSRRIEITRVAEEDLLEIAVYLGEESFSLVDQFAAAEAPFCLATSA
jgi:hypothetical protein